MKLTAHLHILGGLTGSSLCCLGRLNYSFIFSYFPEEKKRTSPSTCGAPLNAPLVIPRFFLLRGMNAVTLSHFEQKLPPNKCNKMQYKSSLALWGRCPQVRLVTAAISSQVTAAEMNPYCIMLPPGGSAFGKKYISACAQCWWSASSTFCYLPMPTRLCFRQELYSCIHVRHAWSDDEPVVTCR